MKLLQLAHRYGFLIIADEVYQLLSFPDSPAPPPPMRAVERSMFKQGLLGSNKSNTQQQERQTANGAAQASAGADAANCTNVSTPYSSRVVSLGSFSKIMAPGLRLGWVDAAPEILFRLRQDGVLGSGGSIAPLASGIAHSCLELGLLQQHMHGTVRPTLQRNCAALCEALRQELPAGCSFTQPLGGYFVWLILPDEVSLLMASTSQTHACVTVGLQLWPVHAEAYHALQAFNRLLAASGMSLLAGLYALCFVNSVLSLGMSARCIYRWRLTNDCFTVCKPGTNMTVPAAVLVQVCSLDLLAFAQDKFQVKFTPGRVCDGQAHMIRLSFAFYREQELQTGTQRLGAAIRAYLQQQ
jgi:DNA-binding transcriptional MocR family regulator